MKTCWNILIWMWIGVNNGEEHVNGEFVLTSTPLTATAGERFTLICSFRDESAVNIGWLQNNEAMVVTQRISQNTDNCAKQPLAYGHDIINRINVSCNSTAHSITFRFNSTTDQGAAWQCGKSVNNSYDTHPRSNNYTIGSEEHDQTSSPVMSTQSLSTTTRYMETTSDPETVTLKKETTTRYMETTSDSETVTPKKGPLNPKPLNVECNTLAVIAGSTIGTLLLTLLIEGLVLTVLYRKGFRFGNILKGTASQTSTRNPEIEEMDNKGYSSLDHISGPAQNSGMEKEGSDKEHYTQLKIYQNTNVEAKAETSTYDVTEPPHLSYESINASPYQNARAQH